MATARKTSSTNFSNLREIQATCPMQYAMQRLGGRWKMIILWYIHVGVNRFSSLGDHIPNITSKMLTQQLRELEADGLLARAVLAQRPLHVEYSLTETGRELIPILAAINGWAVREQGLAGKSCAAVDESVCPQGARLDDLALQ